MMVLQLPEESVCVSCGYAGSVGGELAVSNGSGMTSVRLVFQREERSPATSTREGLDAVFITDSYNRGWTKRT